MIPDPWRLSLAGDAGIALAFGYLAPRVMTVRYGALILRGTVIRRHRREGCSPVDRAIGRGRTLQRAPPTALH